MGLPDQDDGPKPIEQALLKKYLAYSRTMCKPVLQAVDSEKVWDPNISYRIISSVRIVCSDTHTLSCFPRHSISLSLSLSFSLSISIYHFLSLYSSVTLTVSLSYSLYYSPSHAHHLSLYLSISHKIVSLRFLLFMLSYDDSHQFQVEFPLPYGI